jgi:hypothetical protein
MTAGVRPPRDALLEHDRERDKRGLVGIWERGRRVIWSERLEHVD